MLKPGFRTVFSGIIASILMLFTSSSDAQQDFEYKDKIYADYIKSVQFHVNGLYTSYPILELNTPGVLALSFDDLEGGSKYYYYKIIHCTKDWEKTSLEYYEYLDGYEEEEIRNFAYSVKTFFDYTHYSLQLPNDNMRWTKSGNYLLVVYEDTGDKPVILTRRFMVVESSVAIFPDVVKPANVAKINTHHEIDFQVDIEYINVGNPKTEISATVMQNGRWDNAFTGLISRYERGNRLIFDFQDKIVFPAGKDFRYVDLRSLKYRSRNVMDMWQDDQGLHVLMTKDRLRTGGSYFEDVDLNGQFIIQTVDNFERGARTTQRQVEFGDSTYILDIVNSVSNEDQTEADYIEVTFTLEKADPIREDVYVFGELTDWDLKPEFRMEYDDRVGGYITSAYLKQGYYDYIYVVDRGEKSPDEEYLEGSWYEADNNYTVLIYFSPFGARYDRIVGAKTIDFTW